MLVIDQLGEAVTILSYQTFVFGPCYSWTKIVWMIRLRLDCRPIFYTYFNVLRYDVMGWLRRDEYLFLLFRVRQLLRFSRLWSYQTSFFSRPVKLFLLVVLWMHCRYTRGTTISSAVETVLNQTGFDLPESVRHTIWDDRSYIHYLFDGADDCACFPNAEAVQEVSSSRKL